MTWSISYIPGSDSQGGFFYTECYTILQLYVSYKNINVLSKQKSQCGIFKDCKIQIIGQIKTHNWLGKFPLDIHM